LNTAHLVVYISGYLLGSFPSGLIVGKLWKGEDVRDYGSHNIGATNAFRVLGWAPALLVLLLDIFKGAFSIFIAEYFLDAPLLILLAGVIVVAGHNWSIFLGFNGGRGIATSAGVLLYLMPEVIVVLFIFWGLMVLITRYVSLASISAVTLLPFMIYFFEDHTEYLVFGILIAIFGIYRHTPNIKRLLAGKENKIQRLNNKK